MNPVSRFNIDNYKEILFEIEKLGRMDYLKDLEDRVILEIVNLVHEGTEEAKEELKRLEKLVKEDLGFVPRNRILISALRNSIAGALSAAKFSLF